MKYPLILGCALAMGCTSLVEKTITTTGRIASTTISTAGSVVKVAGKTAVGTAADIGRAAVKESVITLIDAGGGISKLPVTDSMNVYTAGVAGKINLAMKAVELVRMADKTFFKAGELTPQNPGPNLKAGDIIRIVPTN